MTVRLNDTLINIPRSKDEFTLGQRIDFHSQHGPELQKLIEQLKTIEDPEDKAIYENHFYYESVFRTVAFFLGTTPQAIKRSDFIDEAFNLYHSALAPLFEEPEDLDLVQTFNWKGEEWVLHSPELKHGSPMKFGEFIDAKQTVKDAMNEGAGKYEYLLPISAIYLRKKGEEYQESFLHEGSERLVLMQELPMTIAVQVGFFLSCTTSFSMTISKSSGSPAQKVAVSISNSISIAMAGSTF